MTLHLKVLIEEKEQRKLKVSIIKNGINTAEQNSWKTQQANFANEQIANQFQQIGS